MSARLGADTDSTLFWNEGDPEQLVDWFTKGHMGAEIHGLAILQIPEPPATGLLFVGISCLLILRAGKGVTH